MSLSKLNKKRRRISICLRWIKFEVLVISFVTISVMLLSDRAIAYPRYKNDAETSGSNCSACHGNFTDSNSPKGTIFPSNSKHEMHRSTSAMNTACDLCHTDGDNHNPFTDSSNAGPGCIGCHGNDYGGLIGVTGAGLRAHHAINGITICVTCHNADPVPLPEHVPPPYYGTIDTRVNNPCNQPPTYLENWSIGDLLGLDNDGDNQYDNCGCFWANIDGINPVNCKDFALLAANWKKTGVGLKGDINFDGTVDIGDIALLAKFWLINCN